MANFVISLSVTLAISVLFDAMVRPRQRFFRKWQGMTLHLLVVMALFGLALTASGNEILSGALTLTVVALITTVSNAKYAMLGEPLLFSDMALILYIFRHPRFYLTAVPAKQRWAFAVCGPVLLIIFVFGFILDWAPHALGMVLILASVRAVAILFQKQAFRCIASVPDADADLIRLGLIASLLLYWQRWREDVDPPACPPLPPLSPGNAPPDLIVIVQCESFSDPVEITGRSENALAGLALAREHAWQYGNLDVSGFGAYTMRTEYGVLFGRSEADLGFRRYDPFLTAHGELSYALTARLRDYGYHGLFVHPHDMRFYGRDKLMPAIGFDSLIGEESFALMKTNDDRYVNDRMLGASMGELIDKADRRTLIYAVTMENHGPWDKEKLSGSLGGLGAYLKHLRSSDSMLSDLIAHLSKASRTALLVFFGDHRPSIPGVTEPSAERHTPYVMLRFAADGGIVPNGEGRVDLTPDRLHHAILRCVQSVTGGVNTPFSASAAQD